MSAIPAISLWQPYASFIAIGVKTYETRHWAPPPQYIGKRIAIHAAKQRVSKDDLEWWWYVSKSDALPPLGAFVCTATLARVLPARTVPWDEFGDYGEGRFAWELSDVEPIDPPVPAIGRQGFWMWTP
jgi:hypothetical protein